VCVRIRVNCEGLGATNIHCTHTRKSVYMYICYSCRCTVSHMSATLIICITRVWNEKKKNGFYFFLDVIRRVYALHHIIILYAHILIASGTPSSAYIFENPARVRISCARVIPIICSRKIDAYNILVCRSRSCFSYDFYVVKTIPITFRLVA